MGSNFEQYKSLIKQLNEKLNVCENARKNLEEKYKHSEENVAELEKKLANLENDYQRLVLAKALGLTEQQKKDNDRKLARLIEEIDKCLKLLN